MPLLDADVDRSFRLTAGVLAASALLLALLAGAGWLLDVEFLRRPLPRTASVSPLAAMALVLLGGGCVLGELEGARVRRAGIALAGLGGLVGLAELTANATGADLDLNHLVFGSHAEMALPTAAMLALLGLGKTIQTSGDRGRQIARVAALGAGGIACGALVGYALGVEYFYGTSRTIQMAPATALSGLLIACSLGAHVRGRLLSVLVGRTLGGRFLRTALPLIVVVQLAGAVLATAGARAELYSPAAAVWLMTLSALACLGVLVARVALRLHEDDMRLAADARRLSELATRDPLTGAMNRRAFGEEIERAAAHATRYGRTGAVCVIDLDHFKEVNDNYGHQAGDEALVRVYRALRGRLRSTDVLGRLGGDEFAALLPQADQETAEAVAAELAEVVSEVAGELADEGRPSRLGASVGFELMTGEETATELLDRADARMYAAKRAARAA